MNVLQSFPYNILLKYYGLNIFWAEEYWAYSSYRKLRAEYQNVGFEGLVNESVTEFLESLLNNSVYQKLKNTKCYSEITEEQVLFVDKKINIGTSHAPSKIKASNFINEYDDDVAIISIDAHFDLQEKDLIHGKWITKEIAPYVIMVGGWAESEYDFESDRDKFMFYFQSIQDLTENRSLKDWIRNKKIYITLDLDYFKLSSTSYFGYSNYWHRNYLIGHSNTFSQLLGEKLDTASTRLINSQISAGKILGYFKNLDEFKEKKVQSIAQQTKEMVGLLKIIEHVLAGNSARIISFDFVEYSPICDWNYLTISELIKEF
ncbi:MAG: arginase family protein, partial [Candidatus Hodarchaeales archaeon]